MTYEQWLKENKDFAERSLRSGCLSEEVYAELFGELPEDLDTRNLFLSSGCGLRELPRGLTVNGTVKLIDTPLRELPDDIRIGWGSLVIIRSPIERLPENLKIHGELELTSVPAGELPKGLSASHLRLYGCTALKKIADDIRVSGSIQIYGCPELESLPPGLHCGDLSIYYAGIRSLPAGLSVRDLSIGNCAALREFPDNMETGGDVRISEMGAFELPEGFTVKGNLTIEDCPGLKALPGGLVVYGRTEIRNTGIRTLPDDAIFGGDVILRGPSFETLPDGLVVAGDLDIRETGIRTLPENMVIGGTLNIMDLPVTALPGSLRVAYQVISGLHKPSDGLRSGAYGPGRFIVTWDGLVHVGDHYISDGKGMARAEDRKRPSRTFAGLTGKVKARRKRKMYKYDYFAGKIPGRNAISDGETCVKCMNLRDGLFEFTYRERRRDGRGTGQYGDVTMDTVLPADEMAAMYRILTGDGMEEAREKIAALEDLKESYSVREFAELTKGWGNAEAFTGFISRKRQDGPEGKGCSA